MPPPVRVSVATWCQQAVIVSRFECIQEHALGRLVREGLNNVIVYTVSRSCICTIESRAVPEAVSKETPKLQDTDFGDISDLLVSFCLFFPLSFSELSVSRPDYLPRLRWGWQGP